MEKHNQAVFVYVCDSSFLDQSHVGKVANTIHNNIIVPTLINLRWYAKYYIFDCAHPRVKELRKKNTEVY